MSDVKAGGAYIELTVRNKLNQGLAEAQKRISSFSASFSAATGGFLGGLAAFSLSGIVGKITEVLGMADTIADTAARLGMTAAQYQELSHAANMSGASIEQVGAGLTKFNKLIGMAELGSEKAKKTLTKYGLSFAELAKMSPDEKLAKVADVLASMPDDATKVATAFELMGKGGAYLIPLLGEGSKSLKAMQEQANKLGLVTKQEDIDRAAKLNDVWDTVKSQFARVGMAIYNSLVPGFEVLAELSRGMLAWTIKIIDANRGLVRVVFGVASAIGTATAVWVGYQLAVQLASVAMGVYTVAATVATATAAAFNVATGGMPLLIGAVGAAIVAAVAGLLYFSGALDGLSAIFATTWGGIVDAVMGGNLSLAWEIAMKGLELGWATFAENVMSIWNKVTAYISKMLAPVREEIVQLSRGLNALTGGAVPEIKRTVGKGNFEKQPTTAEPESVKLQRELDALREKAAAERKSLNVDVNGKTPGGFDIDALLASVAKKEKATPTFTGSGYFSSAAAGSIGSGALTIQKEQLAATKEMKTVLEEIEENTAEEDDGVFS